MRWPTPSRGSAGAAPGRLCGHRLSSRGASGLAWRSGWVKQGSEDSGSANRDENATRLDLTTVFRSVFSLDMAAIRRLPAAEANTLKSGYPIISVWIYVAFIKMIATNISPRHYNTPSWVVLIKYFALASRQCVIYFNFIISITQSLFRKWRITISIIKLITKQF